jgi:ubiquinone/menaquinone biosynthesis C-methylase UbiE
MFTPSRVVQHFWDRSQFRYQAKSQTLHWPMGSSAHRTRQEAGVEQDIVSAGYDVVYRGVSKSPTLRRLWHELAEGRDFPEGFGHISFTTLPELRRIAAELRLRPGDTLVDLGCGMAGPALWVARETQAHLTGIDGAPAAAEYASVRAAEIGLADRARFVVGSFAATGLEPDSADGVMSEDALQYTPDKQVAFNEVARILRPGGRFVFTAYELDPERATKLPVLGTDPVEDYRPALVRAGFSVDLYEEAPGWPEPMTATYSALLSAKEPLTQEMGAAAVGALFMEMSMTLEQKPYRRRVLVAATKPAI